MGKNGISISQIDNDITIHMPSRKIIADLSLVSSKKLVGHWADKSGNDIFFDPSVNSDGPSCALIRKDALDKWLNINNMRIVWLISGDKQLSGRGANDFYGALNYNTMITEHNGEFKAEIWFKDLRPSK